MPEHLTLDTVLADAQLSRDPPELLKRCDLDDLISRASDRSSFLSWLKAEFSLPIGDRQRICNSMSRLVRTAVAAAPSKPLRRRFASAADAIAAGEVAFVTLTNSGYLAYTANCLTSLEVVREPVPLTVYCADTRSQARISATCPPERVVPMHEEALDQFLAWKQASIFELRSTCATIS